MNLKKMNSSLCVFGEEDGMFSFGGEDIDGRLSNTIEQYYF
jgi:hypothetical protein